MMLRSKSGFHFCACIQYITRGYLALRIDSTQVAISPLGPLRWVHAIPIRYPRLDEAKGIVADRTQRFQFQIGTSF